MQRPSITPYKGIVGKKRAKRSPVRDRLESVLISSSVAHGTNRISKNEERIIRRQVLRSMAQRFGYFELVWYPTFIILDLLCLFVAPFSFMLVLNVVELLVCMTANNIVARGNRWGLLLSALSLGMYCYISFANKVWGEMIINLAIYIPAELIGFFKWKKASEGESNINKVLKLTKKGYVVTGVIFVAMTMSIFAFLNFGLHQAFAIVNAISITACLMGDYFRNNSHIETWYLFMICNISGIVLWMLEVFATGEGLNLSVLPMVVSFLSTLTNNFNGLNIWNKMKKETEQVDRVYLAKRKVNIKGVAKLKNEYRKFVCNETEDVAGLNFRKR